MLLLLLFCACKLYAQDPLSSRRVVLSATTVVKDSSGAVLPYAEWQAKVTGGNYEVKPLNDDLTEFQLLPRAAGQPPLLAVSNRSATGFPKGKNVKLFKVRDMNGDVLDLREPDGVITVLNFWFVNCGPCRKEIPELNELVARYKANNQVRFVAIALDDKPDLRHFLATNPFHYRIVENGLFFAREYRVSAYPTHVVVDGEGKVAFSTEGYSSGTVNQIRRAIERLLQ